MTLLRLSSTVNSPVSFCPGLPSISLWRTVVARLCAQASEVSTLDDISASDIEVAGAVITKSNLRLRQSCYNYDLGEGEVPLVELNIQQDWPRDVSLVVLLQALQAALCYTLSRRLWRIESGPGLWPRCSLTGG